MHQTEHWRFGGNRREFLVFGEDLIDSGHSRKQACQLFAALHDETPASRAHKRRISNELDRVAETLFGPEQ